MEIEETSGQTKPIKTPTIGTSTAVNMKDNIQDHRVRTGTDTWQTQIEGIMEAIKDMDFRIKAIKVVAKVTITNNTGEVKTTTIDKIDKATDIAKICTTRVAIRTRVVMASLTRTKEATLAEIKVITTKVAADKIKGT